MVSKAEPPFERPIGDSAMDIIRPLVVSLPAGDDQLVLLRRDLDLVAAEAGHSQADAVAVIVQADEVERRVILPALARRAVFKQIEKAIKADGGAPEGRKVECSSHV